MASIRNMDLAELQVKGNLGNLAEQIFASNNTTALSVKRAAWQQTFDTWERIMFLAVENIYIEYK